MPNTVHTPDIRKCKQCKNSFQDNNRCANGTRKFCCIPCRDEYYDMEKLPA